MCVLPAYRDEDVPSILAYASHMTNSIVSGKSLLINYFRSSRWGRINPQYAGQDLAL